ncbi:MAG: asparaginase [Litoreibacter sp.]|nr:asparaginase [Litoreibacter sp.]
MTQAVSMVEIWRGAFRESEHCGHAVVCDATGQIVEAWGEPDKIILPRSSCKMLQALPLLESGAAEAAGLGSEHFALACASHSGGAIHTDRVQKWLSDLGLSDAALRCGVQMPSDQDARKALTCGDDEPCQFHNNCSGKHSGFLTLSQHLGGGPEYIDPDHVVQRAVREAFEEMTGMTSPGFAIDGCSAPNFATSVHGLARAMSSMAAADPNTVRGHAAQRLVEAMAQHPELVAGEGRACTELMRACEGRAAVKTGAEAVFVAILPEQGLGIALKIMDGGTRAAEAAIAGLLVKYGAMDASHPTAKKWITGPIRNRRSIITGEMRFASSFLA